MPEVSLEKAAARSPLKWSDYYPGFSGTLSLGVSTARAAPEVKGRYSIHGWRDDDGIGESYEAAYFPHYGRRWEEIGKFDTLAEAKQRAEGHHRQQPVWPARGDEARTQKQQALEKALAIVRAAGYRVSQPKVKAIAPLGLNAVGKPFSPQYDPNYQMRYRPSYGHLRAPYGSGMRFVGDSPPPDKQPQSTPLLNDPAQPEPPSNKQDGVPRTYWLSFDNENKSAGVAIIDIRGDEIGKAGAFFAAIRKSLQLKISPGPDYNVQGHEIPSDAIAEQFKHRLLSHAEAEGLSENVVKPNEASPSARGPAAARRT